MHRGKVDPEVSELPRSNNELSRDHVNRPTVVRGTESKQRQNKVYSGKAFITTYDDLYD